MLSKDLRTLLVVERLYVNCHANYGDRVKKYNGHTI